MALVINLLGNLKIKFNIGYKKSLFKRLGVLVFIFTTTLISLLYYQFAYFFTDQDHIMAAHEMYYYSNMVSNWNNPPDTNIVIDEVENLQMWCAIYKRDTTQSGIAYPAKLYWSNLPSYISVDEFYNWSDSPYFEDLYGIEIPLNVFFGTLLDRPTTVVDNGDYLFYMIIDYVPPAEIKNVIFAIILSMIFIIGLYFFISRYLRPVQLMKSRIEKLENGDLKSKIDIIGEDELADLSYSINKLIYEIKVLLDNKHQLLLEVSHELRSPLARMQLLVAMMPDHSKKEKLINEINFLEGMISNLLLSDRLSLPYSKLELKQFITSEIVDKVVDMFPSEKNRINIINNIQNKKIYIDETKFTLALRNLIDNAIKYSENNQNVEILIKQNQYIQFHVKDYGIGINDENIKKITNPFYQANQSVSTKGFGLGLTICKKIIESHNGFLEINSLEGVGSTFILNLPFK